MVPLQGAEEKTTNKGWHNQVCETGSTNQRTNQDAVSYREPPTRSASLGASGEGLRDSWTGLWRHMKLGWFAAPIGSQNQPAASLTRPSELHEAGGIWR